MKLAESSGKFKYVPVTNIHLEDQDDNEMFMEAGTQNEYKINVYNGV